MPETLPVSTPFSMSHLSQLHDAASLNSRHSCFQRGVLCRNTILNDNCFPICHLHGKIAVFTLHGTVGRNQSIW